jgi:hypothetical protein
MQLEYESESGGQILIFVLIFTILRAGTQMQARHESGIKASNTRSETMQDQNQTMKCKESNRELPW